MERSRFPPSKPGFKLKQKLRYTLYVNIIRYNDGTTYEDFFDTVVFAVGRNAETLNIGIDKAGVAVNPKNGKILHDDCEKTNIEHVACF